MQEYSEKELLLLSNYLYFACSAWDGKIGDNIDYLKKSDGSFDVEKIHKQGVVSCNMSEEEAISLLKDIDSNENIRNMRATRILNEPEIRGVCYVRDDESVHYAGSDSKQNACVIFRGTGGTYEAWKDNVEGEYMTDTRLQKIAGDFVRNECEEFKNITVSGHSKGGNLAQYVTVTCGDQIKKCVSFDGQGFGSNFRKKYINEISIAKPKITSICAYNDYVNILLTGIAGSLLYVKNKGIAIDGHSSYTMYDSVIFDENGRIDRIKSGFFQGPLESKLEETLNNAVDLIDMLPGEGRKKASDILAATVAGYMCFDKDEVFIKDRMSDALSDFKDYATGLLGISEEGPYDITIFSERNYYSGNYMLNTSEVMNEYSRQIILMVDRILDVKKVEKINIAARHFIDLGLDKVCDKLYRISDMLRKHSEFLRNTYRIFENNETGIEEGIYEFIR